MKMRKKPSRTASIFIDFASSRFLNRDQVIREVEAAVETLQCERSDVEEIYLFGSFASGTPTPKSDIDLLIVTETSAETFPPYFVAIPIPVDIHVMTPEAFRERRKAGKGIAAEAATKGTRLL